MSTYTPNLRTHSSFSIITQSWQHWQQESIPIGIVSRGIPGPCIGGGGVSTHPTSCGQTDACENITFRQFHWQAEIKAYVGKGKINLAKKLQSVGIEPGTLGLWGLFVLHSHAYLTELTWQCL